MESSLGRTTVFRSWRFDDQYLTDSFRQEEQRQAMDYDKSESLLPVVKRLGGITTPEADPAYRGGLEALRERFGSKWRGLARKNAKTLDQLAEGLREAGFDRMMTPDDVLTFLEDAAGGKEIYPGFGEDRATFDLAPMDEVVRRADEPVTVIHGRDTYPDVSTKGAMAYLSDPETGVVGPHFNEDSEIEWVVSKSSLNKMVKQGVKPGEPPGSHLVRIEAAYHMPDLIRHAKAFEVLDLRNDQNVDQLFDVPFYRQGQVYRIKIKGKVSTHQGNKAHSMRVDEIVVNEASETGTVGHSDLKESTNAPSAPDSITIRQLFNSVNPYSNTTFSLAPITPEQDAAYLRAAESGDMETLSAWWMRRQKGKGMIRDLFTGDSTPPLAM